MGVLADQLLKLLKVGRVLTEHLNLIRGNIAGEGLALFPALEIVIGAVRTLANDAEFARLHALDLGDLLKDFSGSEWFHWRKYIRMYILYHINTSF